MLSKKTVADYDTQWVTPAAGLTLPLTQTLTFSPDNTYDIGGSATTLRPRDAYLSGTLYAATSVNTPMLTSSGTVTLNSSTQINVQVNGATRWYVTSTGHLMPGTNNTNDFGSTGVRPRDLFLGRHADVGGNLTLSGSGALITGDFTSASQIRFQTNQANQPTSFQTVPNGTSRLSSFFCWDNSNTANAVYAGFSAENGATYLKAHRLGTAPEPAFHIWTGNTARLSIAANGIVTVPVGIAPCAGSIHATNLATCLNLTWTNCTWSPDFTRFDGGFLSNAAGLVVPRTGVYLLSAGVVWAGSPAGTRYTTFAKNASPGFTYATHYPNAEPGTTGSASVYFTQVHALVAGDTIGISGYQSTGGSLAIIDAWVNAVFLGPT